MRVGTFGGILKYSIFIRPTAVISAALTVRWEFFFCNIILQLYSRSVNVAINQSVLVVAHMSCCNLDGIP